MWRVLYLAACVWRGADPSIQSQIARAEAASIRDPADFDRNVAPFAALRATYPDSLLVHERYQDAVRRHGIEGHLRAMADEYQSLAARHSGELAYRYLAARALIGYGTPSAVQSLTAITQDYPNFAPAYCALSEAAATVSPPEPSPLLDRAERLFRENGDAEQIIEMAAAAIRADEWRLQRIRAFNWYPPQLKRQSLGEMQAEYWRFWEIEVHCFRRKGQFEKAQELLDSMQQRAGKLAGPERLAQLERLRSEDPMRIGTTALPRN